MSRKRRVSYNQQEALWEILNQNRALATGYNKSAQAREYAKRMWQTAADNLNSHGDGDGAEKDGKGWCKYWNDFKSKLKLKVASARASFQRTGGGPSTEGRLSELELKFLQILGEDFGSGLPGVRVEPNLDDQSEDWTEAGESDQSISILAPYPNWDIGSVDDLLTMSPVPTAASPTLPEPGLSMTPLPPAAQTPPSPPAQSPHPPPVQSPRTPLAPAAVPRALSTPRRNPRQQQRRRQRRVAPMSADVARRALVHMSEERVRLDEERVRLGEERVRLGEARVRLNEERNSILRVLSG